MTRPINVAVLGATGSIGQQTLDVIDRNPGRLRLFGLTEGRRTARRDADYVIRGQAGEPEFDVRVTAMVTDPRCDLVVVAIPGARALGPTMAALHAGKEVALATKEVLVMAGALVMKAAAPARAQGALPESRGIRPIDSEHSAIWQCLWGEERTNVRRLIMTASGGPLWSHPDLDLDQANADAVNAFLDGDVPFSGIVRVVERALWAFPGCGETLEEILEADRWGRAYIRENSVV